MNITQEISPYGRGQPSPQTRKLLLIIIFSFPRKSSTAGIFPKSRQGATVIWSRNRPNTRQPHPGPPAITPQIAAREFGLATTRGTSARSSLADPRPKGGQGKIPSDHLNPANNNNHRRAQQATLEPRPRVITRASAISILLSILSTQIQEEIILIIFLIEGGHTDQVVWTGGAQTVPGLA